jgi:hypothetical protein
MHERVSDERTPWWHNLGMVVALLATGLGIVGSVWYLMITAIMWAGTP